jgi:pimeloyl-ACP methyl ester carboxylesterase
MLIHALAERQPKPRLGAIALIAAPFVGEGGWPGDDIEPRTEFSTPAGAPVFLYHGTDDDTVPLGHLELYARAIPDAVVRRLERRDHQLGNDLSDVARDLRSVG